MSDTFSSKDDFKPTLEVRSCFDQVHLSYGIELEFVIAYSPSELTSQPNFQRRKDRIAKQMLAQGKSHDEMNAELMSIQKETIRQQVRDLLNDYHIHLADEPSKSKKGPDAYNGWTLTDDATVTASKSIFDHPNFHFLDGTRPQDLPNFEEYKQQVEFADVELISPAWKFSELQANSSQTHNVISIIASHFQVFVPPKTAAFHVHVGNGEMGFSLQQTQNMALLFCTFERQFNQFHPRNRLVNEHCKLPRSLFKPRDRDVAGIWDTILTWPRDKERLETKRYEVEKVLYGDEAKLTWLAGRLAINRFRKKEKSKQAYNFGFMLGLDRKRATTIEFRQHRGTLQPAIIDAWVLAVGSMVQLCCQAGTVAFLDELLELREADLNFPVTELFRTLRLDDLVEDDTIAGHSLRQHDENFGWRDVDYFQKFNFYDEERDDKYDGNTLDKYFGTNVRSWSVSSAGSAMMGEDSEGTVRSSFSDR